MYMPVYCTAPVAWPGVGAEVPLEARCSRHCRQVHPAQPLSQVLCTAPGRFTGLEQQAGTVAGNLGTWAESASATWGCTAGQILAAPCRPPCHAAAAVGPAGTHCTAPVTCEGIAICGKTAQRVEHRIEVDQYLEDTSEEHCMVPVI